MYGCRGKTRGIFSLGGRVCKGLILGMQALHTVDKSQNRNNFNTETVDNFVDDVDRYASIHPAKAGMNMQKDSWAVERRFGRPLYKEKSSTGRKA